MKCWAVRTRSTSCGRPPKFYNENRKVVQAFVAALDEAMKQIAGDPAAAASLWVKAENARLAADYIEKLIRLARERMDHGAEEDHVLCRFHEPHRHAPDQAGDLARRLLRGHAQPAGQLMGEAHLQVEVWRGAASGQFQTFSVPRREHQTILDVVTEIQREQDADALLSLRLPRRHVRLLRHGGERPSALDLPHARARRGRRRRPLRLEPLRNFTVVKDLAVEMTGFFDKWRDAKGHFEPLRRRGGLRGGAAGEPQRQAADAGIECIGCGVCYSACDVVAWNKDYLGPAALNRAWTLVNDVRDAGAIAPARGGVRERAAAMPATPT